MTNLNNLSMVRRFVFAPAAAIVIAGTASNVVSAETQVRVRGGKMETRMENGKVILTGLQGEVAGGQVQMAGNVSSGASDLKSASVSFKDIPAPEAVRMVSKANVPEWLNSVVVSGSVKGQWKGEGLQEIGSSVRGAVTMKTGPGVITDKATLGSLAKLLKVDQLTELRYDVITFKAHAADGQLVVDEIKASGPEFKVAAAGKYSAPQDNLNMKIDLAVSQEIASRSTYLKLKNVFGIFGGSDNSAKPASANDFVSVPRLLVQGELKKPDVSLDKTKPVVAKTTAPAKPATQQVALTEQLKSWF